MFYELCFVVFLCNIGGDSGKAVFVKSQVDEWISNVNALAKMAETEPQLAYAAYVYGLSKKWSFVTPNISEHLKKLEFHFKETLIPAIVGKEFISDDTRRIFSLPARLGGLGFLDPCSVAVSEDFRLTVHEADLDLRIADDDKRDEE